MINLTRLTATAVEPAYGTKLSACFDVCADIQDRTVKMFNEKNELFSYEIKQHMTIPPRCRALIPTGFVWGIPSGYRLNFLSRSGQTWKHGCVVMNSPATIDEDYTDESFVVLYNATDDYFTIEQGQRIAQGEINPVTRCEFAGGGDRAGGFGSTGSN
jgi:dUTP pyrophosphatase